MDLAISPDLDARICYTVVFLCGLISARVQIYKRLSESKITGIWLEPGTWLVFAVYLAIPLMLFWLMDRTGALHDTSLLGALLVGSAYPAILAGGWGGLKAPEGLAGISKPIEAFADTVASWIARRVERNDRRFENAIVGRMIADHGIFDRLLDIARTRPLGANHQDSIDRDLHDIEARAPGDSSGNPAIVEQKARRVYLYVSSIPGFEQILRENSILQWRELLWVSPIYRNRVVSLTVAIALVTLVLVGIWLAWSSPAVGIAYSTWRLGKPNNTELDRFRVRENLRAYLRDMRPEVQARARQVLARALRSPGVSVDRVDFIVQLLLQDRGSLAVDGTHTRDLLVSALRADNVDARCRIQHALVLLATEADPEFKQNELAAWSPNKGDSVTSLEGWIRRWRDYWRQVNAGAPAKQAVQQDSLESNDLAPIEQ